MSGNGQAIIRASNLMRRFGDLTAVDSLDLEVKEGEVFGLLGPDGAGKTTTLRMLCGLLDPDEGEVVMDGRNVAEDVGKVRDVVGYMAQRFGLYVDLTVDENMKFYADLFGVPRRERNERAEQLLGMTRMAEFRKRQAGKLSGGMKQKLALMCVLLHRPRVLLLDEPTNGVDPVSRRDFWSILYGLVNEGVTVLVTTAYLDEAERCNRIGLMYEGRMVQCDTPDVVRQSPEETCYSVSVRRRSDARKILAEIDAVASVEPFGDALHLFLDTNAASVDDLSAKLQEADLGPAEFREIEPSLEDVFILQINKKQRAAAS